MVEIVLTRIASPDVLLLFSEYDDFIIDFLGEDSVYYTRYSENEGIDSVWVAYCDGVPVGCAGYRPTASGTGEVKRLFTKREYRGRGISKLLLEKVVDCAKRRGDRALCLSTRATLEPAVALYRQFGFVETLRNDLYVEMEKDLRL